MTKRRALLSVWSKEELVPFARELQKLGWDLVSSSGTAKALVDGGLTVTEVTELTGFPPMLGGRVKTLHPAIAGGILARRHVPVDREDVERFSIPLLDMVVCTLYPFEEKALQGEPLEVLLEHIDIGGVTLLRAAAKNFPHVVVVTDPGDYPLVLEELRTRGDVTLPTRQRLALRAFSATAIYDATIEEGLRSAMGLPRPSPEVPLLVRPMHRVQELRYGENPHQLAGLFLSPLERAPWKILGGKSLSYNNILDLDTALRGMELFSDAPSCILVKHCTPCGIAQGSSGLEALERSWACDPVSAYGGIAGFSREVDAKTCEELGERFLEIVAAPSFDPAGLEKLKNRRPSLRLVQWPGKHSDSLEYRSTWSGTLVQEDRLPPIPSPSQGTWVGTPRPDLWDDLIFAWKSAALSKSNAIVVAREGQTLGLGRGFPNRVDAVRWALAQAGERALGAVLASDAFFPFADSLEEASRGGIAAVIQPGGSVRDAEVFAVAERLGLAMFVGGGRTFRH